LEKQIPEFFSNYADASASCELGYQLPKLVESVFQKTISLRDQLLGSQPAEVDLAAIRPIVAVAISSAQDQHLNVLDYGGACGHHYYLAKLLLGDKINLHWNVVETKAMVKAARQLENEHLIFFDTLSEAIDSMSRIDLIFSSGALQYVSDPVKTLGELVACGAEQLFITRVGLSMHNHETISVQVSNLSDNGPGPLPQGIENCKVQYPVTFIPKRVFESKIASNYRIDVAFTEDQNAYIGNQEKIHLYGYFACSAHAS